MNPPAEQVYPRSGGVSTQQPRREDLPELLRRSQRDPAAREAALTLLRRRFAHLRLPRVPGHERADLLQVALLAAWTKVMKDEPDSPWNRAGGTLKEVEGLLIQIGRQSVQDAQRFHERRGRDRWQGVEDEVLLDAPTLSAEDEALPRLAQADLLGRTLPPQEAKMLRLRLDGHTNAQIANYLGLSHTQVNHAFRRLQARARAAGYGEDRE